MKIKSTVLPVLALCSLVHLAHAQTLDPNQTTTSGTTTSTATTDTATLDSVSTDPNIAALRESANTFSRMFRNLPSFAPQTDPVRQAMQRLGQVGGLLDAVDVLTDPIQSITNPAVFSPNNGDNAAMTAGMTFLGQFLDHDITLDKRSPLLQNASPARTVNSRTAAFDLDSVYGNGPAGSPELYTTVNGRIKFKLERIPGAEAVSRNGAPRYDLPRTSTGQAIVAEFRNDENVILSQFQVAMLRFHNAVTDHLAAQPGYAGASPAGLFAAARRHVTWHYQWIILNEFLPLTIGQARLNSILTNGTRFFNAADPINQLTAADGTRNVLLPIEFAVSAYRFGHSQVRPSYRLNFGPTGGSPFFAFIFDDTIDPASPDPADLRGGKRAPRRFVDWQTFFNFGDGNVRPNKLIDIKLSTPLMVLPGTRGPAPGLPSDGVTSLAARNLMRHVNFGIPSGQAVAQAMGVPALTPNQLSELVPYSASAGVRLEASTPLWYYIMKEAQLLEQGQRLGPVGGGIVGEVFVSLLRADQNSYLALRPTWRPSLPSATPGTFKVTDLLKMAGVVPAL